MYDSFLQVLFIRFKLCALFFLMTTEETVDIPVTTENIVPIYDHMEVVQPHYLSSSSGTCHDACKNGFKDVSDTKVSKPFLRKGTPTPYKTQDVRRSILDPVQRKQLSVLTSVDSLGIKKEKPNNREVMKKETQQPSKKVPGYLRRQTSSPAELKHACAEELNSPKPLPSSPSATRPLRRRLSEIIIPKDLGTPNLNSPGRNKRNSVINRSEELSGSAKQCVDMSPKPSQTKVSLVSSPRQFSRRHGETVTRPKSSGIHRMTSLEGSSIKRDNDIKQSEVMGDSAKHSSALKQKPLQTKESTPSTQRKLNRRYSDIIIPRSLEPIILSPVGGSSGRRNFEKKTSKETGTPKIGRKNFFAPERISSSPTSSIKKIFSTRPELNKNPKRVVSASVKQVDSEHHDNENVLEKTLYIIDPQSENPEGGLAANDCITTHLPLSSSPVYEESGISNGESGVEAHQLPPTNSTCYLKSDSSSSSSLSQSPASFSSDVMHGEDNALESCESEGDHLITDLELEPKRARRIGGVGTEDRDWSPKHLIFKSGKTVDVLNENISPMRLKFREGKVLAENENAKLDTEGRSLRRLVSDSALYETKPEPVKVALKHQDVEEKKDNPSLFNNVIEETASKLARTRKSKVKALVGAFESIISLGDTKSSEITST